VVSKAWLSVTAALGATLFADGAPSTVFSQCQWVTGPACTLGAEVQSVCTMTASCPSGTKVVSGACEGFTSVAIGRSAPDTEETAWGCAVSRVSRIQNPNQIAARALCCP